MDYVKTDTAYIIRLDPGEEVHDSLTQMAAQENIHGAFYSGIGSLQDVVLAYFSLEQNDYMRRCFYGNYELISFTGNISMKDDSPMPHSHCTIGTERYEVIGGHFVSGVVTLTVELQLIPLAQVVRREAVDRNFSKLGWS